VDFSPRSKLTALQRDLLVAFFERQEGFFLTGGAALSGFYLGHRTTDDLDLFAPPGASLDDAARALSAAAISLGGTTEAVKTFPEFRRLLARRGEESCVVDLVVDRAPMLDVDKPARGRIRIDTMREIAANKISALLGRAEIKDLVDLRDLLDAGISIESALADASSKDASADAATVAWILDQIKIGPGAALPGAVDPVALDRFRAELVVQLQEAAFKQASRGRG